MKGLETWQAFNKSAKIAVSVLVAFLVVSLVRSCGSESELDKWRSDFNDFRDSARTEAEALTDSLGAVTDSVLAVAEAANDRADSLTVEIADKDDIIEDLQERTEVIAVANDSTFSALTHGNDVDVVVDENVPQAEPWIRLAFSQRDQIGLLIQSNIVFSEKIFDLEERDVDRVIVISSLRAGLMFQTERADSLRIIVLNIPTGPPQEKLLGFIPLPSRQASFLIGGISTLVTYIAFDNWLSRGN